MSQYTYTLHPGKKEEGARATYKRSQLEKMTTFQLKEICRKEKLVAPSLQFSDREGWIRLIMRFRGQKDYRHIDTDIPEGLSRLQEFLDRSAIRLTYKDSIRIPGTIILYRGTGLCENDHYRMESDSSLYEGNLLLMDETGQVYTCFFIREKEGVFYLFQGRDVAIRPLEKHQYSIVYFPDERISEFLYDCYMGNQALEPGYVEGIRIPLLDIEVRETAETALPLIIDFGSSNTTMGICRSDGSVGIARVEGSHVIPSVIGVEEIRDGQPQFVFGYDALRLGSQNYQDEDVPVFYDIKRWISDAQRTESVILKNGHKYQIARKEMLRAFLEYLIGLGRQQFKCSFRNIQLLAPIRQKEKFGHVFRELLPECYQVDCTLDEGMAVLFQSINNMVAQDNYRKGYWYHALIIDCGGGTTDLTSGRFRIDNSRVSYTIDLETSYENGDTNFGGNNLTFRILQLIKVKIAAALGNGEGRDAAADYADAAAGRGGLAARGGAEETEEAYRLAEAVLPTRFREYEDRGRQEYFMVKNNYYYLFELAERVKKLFFHTEFCYELWIGTRKESGKNSILLDKWKLSVVTEGRLSRIGQDMEFPLYLNQIEELLRPDIYSLMERFLGQKFEQGGLQEYEMIKLTGQSCKSSLFTEALKEYVPGKLIRRTKRDADGTELKMCCLEGALAYFLNRKLGYMKVNQDYQVGTLPYEIMAYTHENKEKILIHSLDREDHIGYISRFMIGKQLDLYLSDERGRRLRTYYFEYDPSKFTRTTQEEIDEKYQGTVIQEETDIILEGEMKFFVWVSRKRWGFIVLPVLREKELLYMGEETFFDFEDDTWEQNFFDGRK